MSIAYGPAGFSLFVVMSNTDLTEGKGSLLPLAVCYSEVTAIRLAKGKGVQGTDASVEEVEPIKEEGGFYFIPMRTVQIIEPTEEDKKIESAKKTRLAILEKANKLGITEKELMQLCNDFNKINKVLPF